MYVKHKEQSGSPIRHDRDTYVAGSYHGRGTILSQTQHDLITDVTVRLTRRSNIRTRVA